LPFDEDLTMHVARPQRPATAARGARARRLMLQTARVVLLSAGWLGYFATVQASTSLADQPLFSNTSVPGNLALALSVEWPTVSRAAHPSSSYTPATVYRGYFDHLKCYRYVHVATETATEVGRFDPVGTAGASHACPATGVNGDWSGNFLNWATMIAVDPFRWALTGGLRKVDTVDTTVLERARHSGQGSLFPNRTLSNATTISNATPFTWGALTVRTQGAGTRLIFSSSGNVDSGTPASYDQAVAVDGATVYQAQVRVKVCVPGMLESNCRQYGANWKPEGLIHQYAEKMRYSAFGYLNDPAMLRDGGVLRARQKYVGPQQINPGSPPTANPLTEWDPATGIFHTNPNPQDATDTTNEFGIAVANSGVINYLNKFGQLTTNNHKNYDPVSEMYYAVTRYFRNLGNVPEWTAMGSNTVAEKARFIDAFPVITNWNDPVQYSCQRNFVLGIGDIYTHRDKNLPGTGTGTVDEPPKPALVASDPVDSVVYTTKAFALQGLGAPNASSYSGRNNSAGMVGLAYHANTNDLRPDIAGRQTLSTYWVDVLEQPFVANNQFYLAAKYGGFKVPNGFDPLMATGLDEPWWYTTTDMVGSQKRPDNYFTAGQPDQMIDGLSRAFASIAAAMRAYTTSFSTSLPQVSIAGNASFSAQYDSENWTGEMVASELSFSATDGTPSQSTQWTFSAKLAAQLAGTGWDTNRRVVTWSGSAGVPFRSGTGGITSAQLAALNTPYRTGDDSADYLNYLRGQRLHEQASTDAASSRAYRTRTGLLGDIVGSKARPVGPPSLPLSNGSNPGYGTFKSAYAARPTVVYVGANDGKLHAVNGALTGTDAGKEIFAYVPNALFNGPSGTPAVSGLAALGNPAYQHRFFVNATPAAFDIDFGRTVGGTGTDWRSVLIGGLGKGGRSWYAIDITDPGSMTTEAAVAGRVLWEFTDPDMGYSYGEPLVVKTRKYGWVALLTSGHNNANGQGYIFIVNPRTGELLEKIGTGVGSAAAQAGLAHINAFALDRTDGTVDAAYAGDLLGNVWRLDLRADSGAYPAPLKLAELRSGSGDVQPVTTRPLIEVDPRTGRRFLLLGSGRMLDTVDIGSTTQQSFYAIIDGTSTRFNGASDLPSGVTFPILRSHLADNTNLLDGITYNVGTQIGWYVELGTGGPGALGWRVVSDPSSAYGIVTFASTLPSGDACNPAGSTRIYAVDFGNGVSVLTAPDDSYINYSTAMASVVTDLRFFAVAGIARLIAGSDTGELGSLRGRFGVAGTIRRLNWRELPSSN
jgi:type IV pilus assembly protein PilY1